MTYTVLFLLLSAMSICMGIAVRFRMKAVGARTSALMMSRVVNVGVEEDGLRMQRLPPKRIAKSPFFRKIFTGAPMTEPIALLLDQAGSPRTVAEFVGATFGSAFGVGGFCLLMGVRPPAATFVGFFCATLPYIYFMHQRVKRITAFEAQLPQALEMLTLYLRSGRSLPQAFVATAEELRPPASEEFAVCSEAYRLGRPLPDALRQLSEKYSESVGLKLFSIAVAVMGQTGGNLVEVIERIRKGMEASLMYVLKLRGLTGETRTSAVILGAVPGLFMAAMALIMPEYFNEFFESFLGYVIFALFCTIWISGLVWVRILMASKA